VNYLGFVDNESRRVDKIEARSGTDRAIHVDDQPACAADAVMVIVVRPRLVDRWSAVHDQATQQPDLGQMGQAVIDSLMRYARQNVRNDGEHRRCTCVRLRLDRVEHRDTLTRDTQSSCPDQPPRILNSKLGHDTYVTPFLNDSRKQDQSGRIGVGSG